MLTTPLSLYIHLPWCIHKCPYCDFNSHQRKNTIPENDYIKSLLADLTQDITKYGDARPLHTIFIGGGTPSLFSATAIDQLLNGINQIWNITADTEITLEANPGTAEQRRFSAYRLAGINRLSLGIQSFSDQKLQSLGRIHNGQEAIKAVDIARHAGFDNINLDLMFGLPKQSVNDGLADLQQAITLQPTHISWYQLTLEPNTLFYKKPPRLPDEDLIFELQQQGQDLLAASTFQQYEISAYAQPNQQCQHNINYWQFGDYLGIGAGAHGKITNNHGQIIRTRKIKQPNSYLQHDHFLAAETPIAPDRYAFEYLLNTLRLTQPTDLTHFTQQTGLSATTIAAPLKLAIEKGFISLTGQTLHKTELGQRFLNDLLTLFL